MTAVQEEIRVWPFFLSLELLSFSHMSLQSCRSVSFFYTFADLSIHAGSIISGAV